MVKLAKWANLTGASIKFKVGVSGVPWPGCDSEPGEIVEAPDLPGYTRHCLDAGYARVTPGMQANIEDAQLRAMVAADEARAAPPAPPAPVDPPVPSSPPDEEQPTKWSNRGRSNRNTKA